MPLVSADLVANRTFDYIIIGGGTAGLTLASRLSENPAWSILVLEAGNSHLDGDHPLITRPGQYGMQFTNPEYDWAFTTVPQNFCNNMEYLWSRGKGLGGSSAMNFAFWTLPPKEDIDNWEKLGNPGWNHRNYQKYSTRPVTYTPLDPSINPSVPTEALNVWSDTKTQGEGPLHITHPRLILDADIKMDQTLLNMGLNRSRAPYGGDTEGTYLVLNTVHPTLNSRTSAVTAVQACALQRPNLCILIGAQVSKVLSSNCSKSDNDLEATGVEFSYNSSTDLYQAHVRREVILSAGSLKSPQILELSGIGRPDVLSKIGVEVKIPLDGVGENVQEHQFFGCSFKLRDDYSEDTYDLLQMTPKEKSILSSSKYFPNRMQANWELIDYCSSEGQGIYTTGMVNIAFMPLKTITPDASMLYAAEEARIRQDIQQNKYPPGLAEQYELQLEYNRANALDCEISGRSGASPGPNHPQPGKKYFTIYGFSNHNFSRGTIHSTSSNPRDRLAIDPHYFERDIDLQICIREFKYIREIAKMSPLKDIISDATMELNPGPEVETDEQIANWLKQSFTTAWHTVGSLSMLPKDKNGVVDPKLKVYGTKNIRVVDLSIVPLQFSAHTQATAYIIAEMAADIIKGVFVPQ
ncbi:GMC oxidoreductase [Rhodocollybia butyracea]|uniref:GMC oxidoreductase n=1 Tax=Rhodocollybia butyracea TaxID=206335 RepID=A0A9P5Q173_9AGAR|nr:GMC oxidoreductase [Rhodocollybia butyracea]